MKNLKKIASLLLVLLATKFSHAGPTEDLWTAIKSANYPNALAAIAAGADVKNMDPAFGTPLNLASCWANAEVVKALIDAKSEVNFVSPVNGYSPLTNAAFWGNVEAVKLLLANGANLNAKDKLGRTLLAIAVTSSNLEVLKLLVAAGADVKEKYDMGALKEQTAFNAFFGAKEPEDKIAYLANVSAALGKMGVSFPPHLANPKASDYSSLESIGTFLIENGADVNQKNGGWGSNLGQACDMGMTGIAAALIKGNANVNFAIGNYGRTPLFFACSKGNAKIVQMLIDGKADLNKESTSSFNKIYMRVTPLMMASALGNDACVDLLCKAGADVNKISIKVEHTEETIGAEGYHVKTTYKDTALSFADANDHASTVDVLKKYGALFPKQVKK